ncbi:dual OB domain-containing protein [Dictyobacter formicarum]|uniref:Dual OB-containing domain-containing protein n=1 Tax=Dictyobacter formicarum TaxID=2778368 RepID=A0ABQ3VBX2_9CHLR|nr:hypothetical protein [Dictyobacter formicarum]GHO83211.1 hypothetical protein KSZ_12170 [Dictyobacter formicarum]
MKVWITAKIAYGSKICLHGLTEDKKNVRLLRNDGSYYPAATGFNVGQIWDMTFSRARRLIAPHSENVIVTSCKLIGQEADMRAFLCAHVSLWQGGPDQLFGGSLRSVLNKKKLFISEGTSFQPISMGYWLSDTPLIKWHDEEDHPGYRYYTSETEHLIDYQGAAVQVFKIPADSLVHVALTRWWVPSNRYAAHESTKVKRRCYLYIAGWYE